MASPDPMAVCSSCGRRAPREAMFGAEPDLLCEACATDLRERLTPRATGRMLSAIPTRPATLTIVVLAISAVLFFFTQIAYKHQAALYPEWLFLLYPRGLTGSVGTGQVWRLLTSAFLHGGWLHFIFNAFWVWALGSAVEGTRKGVVFTLLFLGSAFASSAAQWIFQGGGIGLSGVLYAFAAFLWTQRKRDPVAASVMNPGTTRLLAVWFVICILIPQLNVANWAHGGGIAWGLGAGAAANARHTLPWALLLAAATVGLVLLAGWGPVLR